MRRRRLKTNKETRQPKEQKMVWNGIQDSSDQSVEVQEAKKKAKKTWIGF
jgi:hypothetical protein